MNSELKNPGFLFISISSTIPPDIDEDNAYSNSSATSPKQSAKHELPDTLTWNKRFWIRHVPAASTLVSSTAWCPPLLEAPDRDGIKVALKIICMWTGVCRIVRIPAGYIGMYRSLSNAVFRLFRKALFKSRFSESFEQPNIPEFVFYINKFGF